MHIRFKCPSCGTIVNANPDNTCPKCHAPFNRQGLGGIQLYRKGNFYGMAAGFGIYIDGEPFGHIGNKENMLLVLPFGTHNIHIAVGLSRKCNDLQVTITPQAPIGYAKVWIRPGFISNKFFVDPATPDEMPETVEWAATHDAKGNRVAPAQPQPIPVQVPRQAPPQPMQQAPQPMQQAAPQPAPQYVDRQPVPQPQFVNQQPTPQPIPAPQPVPAPQPIQQQEAPAPQPQKAADPYADVERRHFFCMYCGQKMGVPVLPHAFTVTCPKCGKETEVAPKA